MRPNPSASDTTAPITIAQEQEAPTPAVRAAQRRMTMLSEDSTAGVRLHVRKEPERRIERASTPGGSQHQVRG